ncbi:CNS1 [Candida pseudojiufengensis]|uniref:CNS1 n=1 Tax=Candida pseudojiufengensis TaxID=497109 RepID=UPI0022242E67|nr:CNS1 [Candida pseudojiufengensis]KAI5961263.1 CNS1 [Candida pseudojiufengensis]
MSDPKLSWEGSKYDPKPGQPELPPQLAEFSNKTTDQVLEELNRLPFFMTKLDETDGEGGENAELEALKSLAYDGKPDEIALNFKNQGNDCYKAKQYQNAVIYYTKGLEVDCVDDEINKALYLNRAACDLELKNYRKCIGDCKQVLQLDEKSVKACYRAGKAFSAINQFEEAKLITQYGLMIEEDNKELKSLKESIEKKEKDLADLKKKREEEQLQRQMKQTVLDNSIKLRHIEVVQTRDTPEMLRDAKIKLEDPKDYQSQLIFPALILYPTIDEFDFIAEVSELTTPLEILEMILNRPKEWFLDPKHKDFNVKTLNCYMETTSGGLVKIGKKIPINEALMKESPKVPLFDNSLKLFVVPKSKESEWISQWNKSTALQSRIQH